MDSEDRTQDPTHEDPHRIPADTGSATPFYAHTPQESGDWHHLPDHLEGVAKLAYRFAADFEAGEWGYAAGLWHDLGKFSPEFQEYLRSAFEDGSERDKAAHGPDHSTAGAQHAVETIPVLGHLLAYSIAGHHGGLPDGLAPGPCLEKRLKKEIPEWRHGVTHLPSIETPGLPPLLRAAFETKDGFSVAFFARMLFSCLVDSDFLDTECHMSPERAAERPEWPTEALARMADALDQHAEKIEREASPTTVNRERAQVRNACLKVAEEPPGLFSLTVPTGGGKTLSSLSFALRHALRHGLKRVVYVIPFTSIIEQNAGKFREVMAPLVQCGLPDPVLEHHSNVRAGEDEDEGRHDPSKLATENWDAPLVVTTSVQFYESLFANRTSRCRKLHNLSRAVVILDEAQTLPVEYLQPCLAALRELSEGYGTTVVLCTATQPAIQKRENFKIGLEGVREIIPDPATLYRRLKRVQVADAGILSDQELASRLNREARVLCIVNTRRHAGELFRLLEPGDEHFHLSALMCPEHRSQVLRAINDRLKGDQPCRVVSTQLIEAGVDIDFPVVYRSMAGLDSIAQAAGRCNRNGILDGLGRTFLFQPADHASPSFVRQASNATGQVLPLHDDPMSLEAVEHFFRLHYWDQTDNWDAKGILSEFSLVQDPALPFLFGFSKVGKAFRLIEDTGRPVIVPLKGKGEGLCEELRRRREPVGAKLLRQLQRYTVQIPFQSWEAHVGRGNIEMVHDRYPVLVSTDTHYSKQTGLSLEDTEMPFLST